MTNYCEYTNGRLVSITAEEYRAPRERSVRFRYAMPPCGKYCSELLVVADVSVPFSDIFKAVAERMGMAPLSTERL